MATKGSATISLRELNRATLARQMLLTRDKVKPLVAIERLVALQAQAARPPFVGLWSRVAGFHREDLHKLVLDGKVVRATFLRGTLHVSSARDYLALRTALEPLFAKALAGLGARAKGIDVEDIVTLARPLFAKPVRFEAVRAHLKKLRPALDERAMGYAARLHVPLVHVPSGEAWTFAPDAEVVLADGVATDGATATRELVRRYLTAFGPASVTDAQAWSGLSGLKPAFEELRSTLVTFVDEKKRELFDVVDGPRPSGDVEAPVRFIADFDNLVLGHADRTRVVADEHKKAIVTKNLLVRATFLVDGFVAGTWKTERAKGTATLTIEPFVALAKKTRDALEEEGERLLGFVEPDVKARVTFAT